MEAVSTSAADSEYILNLGTKGLTTGTYRLKVYVGGDNTTGVLQGEVNISLQLRMQVTAFPHTLAIAVGVLIAHELFHIS